MDNNLFVELFHYNLWATLGLMDACAALEASVLDGGAEGTYGSIRDTLQHILGAEQRFVAVLRNDPHFPALEAAPFPGFAALRDVARENGEALAALAAAYEPGTILRGMRGDKPYELPAGIVLMQAIHHGNDHRSHIGTILGQHGIEPPPLDVWAYHRAMG